MRFGTACAVFLALLILPAGVHAQTTSATLSGTVTDPTDKVVPAVDVAATNVDTGVATATKTNGDGIYLLPTLQPGHYRITVDKQGFRQIDLTGVILQVADAVTRNFHLELGAMSNTITVEGNGLNIDTSDASVSTVIDREFVDELPLNGRSLQNLVLLAPGVDPTATASGLTGNGFSVNGNRDTSSANYTVDGVSANLHAGPATVSPDNLTPGLTVLGTTQSLISLDALQEFRVSTSSYGVEYGTSPGAQIQFQSRAGTNSFHGSAYDYLRNTVFDANDWFANSKGLPLSAERQNDFGATLGGPVKIPHVYNGRNKAFFFFSFEGLRLLQPKVLADESSPTAAYRASAPAALQPFLDALPLPTGQLYGNGWGQWSDAYSAPSRVNTWSLRGDYALNGWSKLFARVSYAPSNQNSINDGYSANTANSMLTATAGVTITPSSAVVNDLRVNFSRSTLVSTDTPLPSIDGSDPSQAVAALSPPSPYGQGFEEAILFHDPSFQDTPELLNSTTGSWLHQWDIVEGVKWQVGRHQLKFGVEWNHHISAQTPLAYEGLFEFESLASIQSSTPTLAEILAKPTSLNNVITRASAYAGDTWKINKRLSVDYGLRWELPFPPHYEGGYAPLLVTSVANPASPTVRESNQLYNMTWRNFAPRLGIAYLLRDAGNFQTVLRTGGGLFYSTETGPNFGGVFFPYSATTVLPAGTVYPIAPSLAAPPPVGGAYTAAQLATQVIDGINPNLALPRVWQWNFTLEQRLGKNQSFTAGYVGSAGRRLYTTAIYFPTGIKDVPFQTNGTVSDYDALQLKYDRHVARGLRSLVSYTWAHSLDDNSVNNYSFQPVWGNSTFDIRHTVSVAMVYSIPGAQSDRLLKAVTSGWELSNNFSAHTGTPASIEVKSFETPDGTDEFINPNIVPGVPIYLYGSQYPGGVRLNPAAFSTPPTGQQGDAGRNQYRNEGFWQLDSSFQRKFVLGEKAGMLRLRVDAFNLLNHPNFAAFTALSLGGSTFGLATSMVDQNGTASPLYNSGGPRSLQISLRYEF